MSQIRRSGDKRTVSPAQPPRRPAGMQHMGVRLYALVQQAIRLIDRRKAA